MRVLVITPPRPFIDLREAAAQIGLGDDLDHDTQLEGLIAAVCGHLEAPTSWLGRAIGDQVLELRLSLSEVGGNGCVRLPFPPARDLVSVSYLDVGNVERTASLDDLELLDSELAPVAAWPWTDCSPRREAIRIRYNAGYVDVPAPIKLAALRMVGDLFHFPESAAEGTISAVSIPAGVDELLSEYRVYS